MKKWITLDGYGYEFPGKLGFLAELFDINRSDTVHWSVRPSPIVTVNARKPILYGGAGAYNNKAWIAHGVCRVLKLNEAETRAYVETLEPNDPDVAAFLHHSGYPELLKQEKWHA